MNLSVQQIKNQLIQELNKLKTPQGFLLAGLPNFNKLFGRDSLIVAWQLLDFDNDIAKHTLAILSRFQGQKIDNFSEEEPGKILHEHILDISTSFQKSASFPYYGSIDSTLFYLMLFCFYFEKTGDEKFIRDYWQNIESAIYWILDYGDKDNDLFIEYERKNPEGIGLYNQGWKDSDFIKEKTPLAIVEVQGYEYIVLVSIAKLIAKIDSAGDFTKQLDERAKSLKNKFNQDFWMEEKKYFALGLDGNKRQIRYITSNPGHLLFTGIVDKDKIGFVVQKLFSKELWTDYGIRTHSMYEENFDPLSYHLGSIWPHDNWLIAQGLKKLDRKEEYEKIKNALLKAYEKIGYLPEYYGVIDNEIHINDLKDKLPDYPQAWSSGALLNFILEDEKKDT